jgi:iron complex outermembrane recepter protein
MISRTNASLIALAIGMLTTPAAAQQQSKEPEAVGLDTIVVTAQRREQTLQDVPIAVAVFNDTFVERSRVTTVTDLVAFTPGVTGTSVSQTTPRIVVRGISTEDFGVGSDPALGIYVDDVYLGRGVSSISDIFDIARVEVVRGPQGTLFGRNTTAGAISITTAQPDPDAVRGNLETSLGRFDQFDLRGAINLPLGGDWAVRFAGSSRTRDGFVRNTLGGSIGAIDSQAFRAALGYSGSKTTASLSFEYRNANNQPGPYINPVLVATDPFGPIASNLIDGTENAARDNIDSYRATLRISHELSDSLTLTSITAYNGFENSYLEDTDASPLSLLEFGTDGSQDSYSQELRLNGESGRLTWFLGASIARDIARSNQFAQYSEEDFCTILFSTDCTTAVGDSGATRVIERSNAVSRNTSLGIYSDVTFKASDRLDIIAGLRFSRDAKDFSLLLPRNSNLLGANIIVPPSAADLAALGTVSADGTLQQEFRDSNWQPRFAINYELSDGITSYASITRGYKAGGFNQLSPGPAFGSEGIWSYEVGLKGEVLDRRLRFDLAAYRFDYSDLQVLVNFGGSVITRNAATADGKGVELSFTALPVEGLTLSGGFAWQDVNFGTFIPNPGEDFSGNRLVRTPEFSRNFIADLDTPLTGTTRILARAEYSYRSSQFFRPSNEPFVRQGGFSLVNMSAGLAFGDTLSVRGYVSNLFGKRYLIDASTTVPDLLLYTQRGEPRTFGLQASMRY